jgi:hypothetical protein
MNILRGTAGKNSQSRGGTGCLRVAAASYHMLIYMKSNASLNTAASSKRCTVQSYIPPLPRTAQEGQVSSKDREGQLRERQDQVLAVLVYFSG